MVSLDNRFDFLSFDAFCSYKVTRRVTHRFLLALKKDTRGTCNLFQLNVWQNGNPKHDFFFFSFCMLLACAIKLTIEA
jgi:hypothetical protein